jgi:DNA polymerase I
VINIKLLIIDADYTYNRQNEPVIRIYGKAVSSDNLPDGNDIVLYVTGFEPYLYLDNCGHDINMLYGMVEKEFKGYIKRIEKVYRFRPIGYQQVKSEMLRIILFNPKVTPDVRLALPEKIAGVTDEFIYEADILFRDRFLVDMGISGMDVIEFAGEILDSSLLRLGCNNVYICDINEIKKTDDIVKMEY